MFVIADDITGAAEMAGIAWSRGLPTSLLIAGGEGSSCCVERGVDGVTVIATDTRSMGEAEAAAEVRRIAASIPVTGAERLVFKKTDSALRGHVVAELRALMEQSGCLRAVFLPANPSKGRIVRGGVYYIVGADGQPVPLADTDFSFDPEFPAHTSVLSERFPDAAAAHIVMPDAVSDADIRQAIARYDDGQTLFAGAADLFRVLLDSVTPTAPRATLGAAQPPVTAAPQADTLLVLCGSTQSRPLHLHVPTAELPLSLYDGGTDVDAWVAQLLPRYDEGRGLVLTIPHRHRTGKAVAVHLRNVFARAATALVAHRRPAHLVVEGGATAFATLQQLGWRQFCVAREHAPGVVTLCTTDGTRVTLKPGSYPWSGLLS